jgi:formylglycine-generating enzyme required for sulfatase activity
MKDIIEKCLPTYEIIDKIGEGIHGSVFKVRDQLKERAVKIVPIRVERSRLYKTETDLDTKVSQDFHAVREYYETIKGDGVVGIYDFHLVDKHVSKKEAEAHLVILMELCPINLQDYVIDRFPISAGEAMTYMKSLAMVLDRLSHRGRSSFLLTDFKPSNLLLSEDSRLLIGDLGGLKRLSSVSTITNAQFTPNWSAPELVLKGERPSVISAIYSYGLVSYYIWEGQLPYEKEDFIERIRLIREKGTHYDNPSIPLAIHELILQCLSFEPEDRPGSFSEIVRYIDQIESVPLTRTTVVPEKKKRPPEPDNTRKEEALSATLDLGTRKPVITMSNSSQPLKSAMKTWKEPRTGMEFVLVRGGVYRMGCESGDPLAYEHEKPCHDVEVKDFWIGRYPVTQAQWKAVMGNNPSHFIKTPDHPVEQVSWDDVQKFIQRFNENPREGGIFLLPTESQWEFAARSGGQDEIYSGGSDLNEVGWFKENSEHSTMEVGLKKPNGLGLYDLCGNVMEWCDDLFDEDAYKKAVRNIPVSPRHVLERVVRGGAFNLDARRCRTTARRRMSQGLKYINLGFRLVISEE